jgi:hypothetical protein
MRAPGHLREAFVEWVDDGARPGVLVGEDNFREGPQPVRWLLGRLWNCSDIMPRDECAELDMDQGSTYGQAAQALLSTS